jgi:hypothetical protein
MSEKATVLEMNFPVLARKIWPRFPDILHPRMSAANAGRQNEPQVEVFTCELRLQ